MTMIISITIWKNWPIIVQSGFIVLITDVIPNIFHSKDHFYLLIDAHTSHRSKRTRYNTLVWLKFFEGPGDAQIDCFLFLSVNPLEAHFSIRRKLGSIQVPHFNLGTGWAHLIPWRNIILNGMLCENLSRLRVVQNCSIVPIHV